MKTYTEILKYIYNFITDRKKLRTETDSGLSGPKYLMELLGNPQEKIPIIHIAGTSGKGSTSYLISTLLRDQGFNVGLFLSPHITDVRERFQINNKLISRQDFSCLFQEIIPAIEKLSNSAWGKPSYFVILMAFSFYLFWKRKVDFAVIETGLGGLLDATNIIQNPNKIAVITKIGLDHQWFLGNTYAKIAFQKAGIIQMGNKVITIKQSTTALKVIKKRVQEKKAKIHILNHESNIKNVKIDQNSTTFDFRFQDLILPNLKLGLIGYHQAENAAEALAALCLIGSQYKFKVNTKKIYTTLKKAIFPGRFEIIQTKKRPLVIDGAHNPQKMATFIKSLIGIYPQAKFDFLISFSSGKDQLETIRNMLKKIIPHAKNIYLTEFKLTRQDNNHTAITFSRLRQVLNKQNFKNYTLVRDPDLFLKKDLPYANNPLVVTGSLYLISSLYQIIKNLERDLV